MRIIWKIFKFLIYLVCFVAVGYFIFSLFVRPSEYRDWSPDEAVLAKSEFKGNLVSIKNVRNIKYLTTSDYEVRYYDKTYDLNKLNSVWYMVEPFSGYGAGAAHTLVSFGFSDGSFVSISAEIRKEKGESFSAVKGLLRQYEIVYIVADEKDVIKLRSNYRKDDVFLYPVKTTPEKMKQLFVSMLTRANKLASEPEFYNTLTNTCTTNIVAHVNEITRGKVPFSFKVLMPAYSDELAYNLGLLNTKAKDGHMMTLEEMRARYKINERAVKYGEDVDFSERIRE